MPDTIHILLVEDHAGDARLIREMLIHSAQEQIDLTLATTLEAALAQVEANTYNAILLNLSLPDSSGIDTLLKIRAAAVTAAIVVLTDRDDESLGFEAVQAGAQDYLSKGDTDSRLLVRSLRYAIERQQSDLALRRSEAEYRSLIDDVFDTSMLAVLILDSDFEVVWCNEATEIYFGIGRERLLGYDKRKLIDDELKCIFADPDDYSARLLRAYAEKTYTDRFECHVLPQGNRQERWLEHWSQPIRDGQFVGGRIEQYTDITDRKLLEFAEREQRKFTEALRDIGALLTGSLNLDEVLERILVSLGRVVPHDAAAITIMKDGAFQVARRSSHGDDEASTPSDSLVQRRSHLDYRPYAAIMLETRQPMIIADVAEDDRFRSAAVDASVHAYVGIPIQLQDRVIGFIHLVSEQPGFFQEVHTERLSAFSELAATAMQNAHLYDQSRQLAALEERQRLARELHDSVSQTLFTCRTMSESALRRWQKDPDSAYELMTNVNRLTATALAEMRILLLELRPSALTRIGLKQLFEQYLQPIQDRREFDLVMSIEDIPALPPDVQVALYRITQEALNNIDKHAQAQRVEVSVTDQQDRVVLNISDNGRGFAEDEVAATSLGLGMMRERAQEIGATIHITSAISEGTQISVIWERKSTL